MFVAGSLRWSASVTPADSHCTFSISSRDLDICPTSSRLGLWCIIDITLQSAKFQHSLWHWAFITLDTLQSLLAFLKQPSTVTICIISTSAYCWHLQVWHWVQPEVWVVAGQYPFHLLDILSDPTPLFRVNVWTFKVKSDMLRWILVYLSLLDIFHKL